MRKVLLDDVADVGVSCGPTRLTEEVVGMFGVEKELRVCVGLAAMKSLGAGGKSQHDGVRLKPALEMFGALNEDRMAWEEFVERMGGGTVGKGQGTNAPRPFISGSKHTVKANSVIGEAGENRAT